MSRVFKLCFHQAVILVGEQSFACVQLLPALEAGVGSVRREVLSLQVIFSRVLVPHNLLAEFADVALAVGVLLQMDLS